MALRRVSALKFVGTISLGLLTGLSYTLSTLTVPTLLTLPSATSAAKAFRSLTGTASTHLCALASLSTSAFFLAFALSPRPVRHPYLLYTSILAAISRLAVCDSMAPSFLFAPSSQPSLSSSSSSTRPCSSAAAAKGRRATTRQMEMSYDVVGSDAHSDATPDSASDKSVDADQDQDQNQSADTNVNGEEVRGEVETFFKKQIFATATAGLGFVVAVVGIWGDGAPDYVSETFVNVVEF